MENITVTSQLPAGSYEIWIRQFNRRETSNDGYDLEIEVNGETHTFGSAKSPRQDEKMDVVRFKVLQDGQVTFDGGKLTRASSGTVKWGLKTGTWHNVRAITLSPNHWTKPTGNKHWFFLVEGCMSDEKTRPFYNEFLVDDLAKDRKVSEVLASKIEVATADGAELSGLGFSETIRNHLFLEVEGQSFKRQLKVKF